MSSIDISYQSAIHAIEIAVLTLTGFNTLAAILVLVFVLLDNHRYGKRWLGISRERRAPLFASIAIILSQVVFLTRGAVEMGSVDLSTAELNSVPHCSALNQLSWYGVWFPLIVLGVRVSFMAGAIMLRYNPFSTVSETIYLVVVITIASGIWLPSHFLPPTPCSPFVVVLSPTQNTSLAVVAVAFGGGFLLLILLSSGTIAWHNYRARIFHPPSQYQEFDTADVDRSISSGRTDRIPGKIDLIHYGLGIFCLYACVLPNYIITALVGTSETAAYIASIAIHSSGILLLFQYLLLRNICPQCNKSPSDKPEVGIIETFPDSTTMNRSLSGISSTSDFTRKRHRSVHSSGSDQARAKSTWIQTSTETTDTTAGGRKVPPKLPAKLRPPSDGLKSPDLRRNKSTGSVGRPQSSMMERRLSAPPEVLSMAAKGPDPPNKPLPAAPPEIPLKLRRKDAQMLNRPKGNDSTSSTAQPTAESSAPMSREARMALLAPILLPPLAIHRETRQQSQDNSFQSTSNVPGPSRSDSYSRSQPVPATTAPLRLASTEQSSPIDYYEEDFPTWRGRTPQRNAPAPTDSRRELGWPLRLDDFSIPEPPFITDDIRNLFCPTPSESRLSTITEEETVRSSAVQTPQNVITGETARRISGYFEGSAADRSVIGSVEGDTVGPRRSGRTSPGSPLASASIVSGQQSQRGNAE